jgi:hypothetical protein
MVMVSSHGYGISTWLWYLHMVMVFQHGYGIFTWLWYLPQKLLFFLISPNKVAPDINAQILHLVHVWTRLV